MADTTSAPGEEWRKRARSLWIVLAVQSACAAFFIFDVISDFTGYEGTFDEEAVELAAVIGLVIGIIFVCLELRALLKRHERAEAQLKIASGAFYQLLDENFDAWALTPSERDVAMLAIKGLSLAEIAEVRDTKQGTIKAQCNAIYQKAGVTGRPQLLSLFIEELMADGLPAGRPASAPA